MVDIGAKEVPAGRPAPGYCCPQVGHYAASGSAEPSGQDIATEKGPLFQTAITPGPWPPIGTMTSSLFATHWGWITAR